MAKYTINDTTLVAIADAIRAKSGTTGGIDPADMAALIAAIEAGGGSGGFVTGTFISTASGIMTQHTVEHGLGKTPRFFAWYPTKNYASKLEQGSDGSLKCSVKDAYIFGMIIGGEAIFYKHATAAGAWGYPRWMDIESANIICTEATVALPNVLVNVEFMWLAY